MADLTLEQMARAFHEAAGLDLPAQATLDIGAEFVSDEVRQKILDEEVRELAEAVLDRDLVAIADALADIAYVVAGTAVTYGIPFDAVLAEVHRSNMTKFGPDGPKVRADGKIIKGPGYEPPSIAPLLGEGPWIVHHRQGWCALPPGAVPDPQALNDPTLCRYVVTLRAGSKRGQPDCPECLALLGGTDG